LEILTLKKDNPNLKLNETFLTQAEVGHLGSRTVGFPLVAP